MLSRSKKFLISSLLAVFLLVNFAPSFASAQTWYNQPYKDWYRKVYDTEEPAEIFGERYTHAQVQWIIYSLVAIFTAVDNDLQACIARESGSFKDILFNCLDDFVAAVRKVVASKPEESNLARNPILNTISTNPISSVAYFKDVGQRLKIIPEAQAQGVGFGFGAAGPMLNLWRQARNATYALLVLVMIVMAFMIMFRVKISPQTVITVQSALPRIVIALILITFSYAIAGLLIDLMYVVIGIISFILTQNGAISNYEWADMFNSLTNRSMFEYMVLYWVWFFPALMASVLSSGFVSATIGGFFAAIFGWLIMLVLAIVLLVVWLRIIWLMFKTFVIVLLLVVIGPIQILLGTFTGGGFGSWLRNIASHLAVYPAVGFMIVLSFVFLRGAFADMDWLFEALRVVGIRFPFDIVQQFPGGEGWTPPFTFTSRGRELAWLGASFVIMTMIPAVGNMIQGFLSGRPFPMSSAIGQAMAAGGAMRWAEGQALGRAGVAAFDAQNQNFLTRTVARLAERRRHIVVDSGGTTARRA